MYPEWRREVIYDDKDGAGLFLHVVKPNIVDVVVVCTYQDEVEYC